MNEKKSILRHSMVKLQNTKEKEVLMLKAPE